MFTIDEMLSKNNQRLAFEHFATKNDGCGPDGMHVSELEKYWRMNHDQIISDLKNQEYQPGIILIREHMNKTGKRRNIASLNVIDRFITRLLSQKLNRYLAPIFCENSYAYQDSKGVMPAVLKAKEYVELGMRHVIEIDLKNYFDTIPLENLIPEIERYITDEAVLHLIKRYLFCDISFEGKISRKTQGIVQGNAISPILSNLYLNDFDKELDESKLCWIRYADNIYVYMDSYEKALLVYSELTERLERRKLTVNKEKSGVFDVSTRSILGYDILIRNKKVDVRKHIYKSVNQYSNWHDSRLEFINGRYHITSDGILNRQDFGLLFENEQKKHYIPVEVSDQLNIYGNVTLASNVLQSFSNREIKVSFFDKYGRLIGSFLPEKTKKSAEIILVQSKNYLNEDVRMDTARRMEIAGLHNIRANLRYYDKKHKGDFKEKVDAISGYIDALNRAPSVNDMMLLEAKARQLYYTCFNQILETSDFQFEKRTKRPPKDAINACISFGNTLLYNLFVNIIWKKGLDPRFGVVHASNKRNQSLNLDFADIFKPIVIDRIIFTMINKKMLTLLTDFETSNQGVYLSREGKNIFLQMYEEKLKSRITIKGKEMSYYQLLESEVQNYKNFILTGETYKPYKYY